MKITKNLDGVSVILSKNFVSTKDYCHGKTNDFTGNRFSKWRRGRQTARQEISHGHQVWTITTNFVIWTQKDVDNNLKNINRKFQK